jgi:hypothetical protein
MPNAGISDLGRVLFKYILLGEIQDEQIRGLDRMGFGCMIVGVFSRLVRSFSKNKSA